MKEATNEAGNACFSQSEGRVREAKRPLGKSVAATRERLHKSSYQKTPMRGRTLILGVTARDQICRSLKCARGCSRARLTPEGEVADVELARGQRGDGPQDEHDEREEAAPFDDPPLGVVQPGRVVLVLGQVRRVVLDHADRLGCLEVEVLGGKGTAEGQAQQKALGCKWVVAKGEKRRQQSRRSNGNNDTWIGNHVREESGGSLAGRQTARRKGLLFSSENGNS